MRFQKTFRAVTEGAAFKPDEIVSISSDLKLCGRLCMELSQPTFSVNTVGKIVIDKAPDGARSPNLADAVMIRYAPGQTNLIFTQADIVAVSRPGPTSTMRHKPFRFG
jgi:phage terminase large subunit